jgi:hypothetical protein
MRAMTKRSAARRGGRAATALAVLGIVVVGVAAAPAAADPAFDPVNPVSGPFIESPVIGSQNAQYNDGPSSVEVFGRSVPEGGFLGYSTWVAWFYPFDDTCPVDAGGGASVQFWEFVDATATHTLGAVESWGRGWSSVAEHHGLLIDQPEHLTGPVPGRLQLVCDYGDSIQVLASVPLTIDHDPASVYRTPLQWTLSNIEPGSPARLYAMGFAPGESVRVSLVDSTVETDGVVSQSTVVADGAGAVSASVAVPSGWTPSEYPTLEIYAVGATSRYALTWQVGGDGFDPDLDLSLTASVTFGGSTGRLVRVALEDYSPGASAVVALHSAAAPIVLGTVTVAGDGSAVADLPIPVGVNGEFTLWVGEKTVGYALQSVPLTVGAVSPSFSDVPSSSQFADEISWLASSGVTTGYPDGTFRPLGTVNRDAMAAFLYRFAGSPSFTPPTTSPFSDVSTSNQFYKEITWLASSGVTTGYPDGTFRPLGTVNRDAMAAFLYRFAGSPSFTPPTTSPFSDVSTTNQFFKEITWLADTGVTTGYPDGGFHPLSTVKRDAMAAFLYRFDGLFGE